MTKDILIRLDRILDSADERGLDETECRALKAAVREIKRLRDERDQARREVCQLQSDPPQTMFCALPEEYADIRQWDCYKENP